MSDAYFPRQEQNVSTWTQHAQHGNPSWIIQGLLGLQRQPEDQGM